MATIFVNPGTGPIRDADEENAWVNIRAFAKDLAERGVTVLDIARNPNQDDREGRYAFDLKVNKPEGRQIKILMPGIPLGRVRYLGRPQNIWHYPHLYVDGSSWVWRYALECSLPEEEPETHDSDKR